MDYITDEELAAFLESQGITMPKDLIDALLEVMADAIQCMESKGATPAQIKLAICYLMSMLALCSNDMRVTSQTAPNGASRSMRFASVGDRLKALTGMLALVDKHGCMDDLIPDNPESFKAGLWVAPKAGCMA